MNLGQRTTELEMRTYWSTQKTTGDDRKTWKLKTTYRELEATCRWNVWKRAARLKDHERYL